MYSYTLPAHQKIDRVAYRHLKTLAGDKPFFPRIREILHFEGRHGPDATKLKRGAPIPWHFYDPYDEHNNHEFWDLIEGHYKQLVRELKTGNRERAAFEASWLAHGLVDGWTPAHHHPYERELEELRGEDKETRETAYQRVVVKGETARDSLKRNIQMLGPKGLLSTHVLFEFGAATVILPLTLTQALPNVEEIEMIENNGLVDFFKRQVHQIADLHMYERFYKRGWNASLAQDMRRELAPAMVKTVTLAWYSALSEAGLVEEKTKKSVQPANPR